MINLNFKCSIQTLKYYRNQMNLITRTNFTGPKKRFYKDVTVTSSDIGYEINLDNRKLKTPAGNIFMVQSEPLALCIANEWKSQGKDIKFSDMHLTTLTNTAIDSPTHSRENVIIDQLLEYFTWDTILFYNEKEDLLQIQEEKWDPLINWFIQRYECKVTPTRNIEIVSPDPKTLEILARHFKTFNRWSLLGIKFAAENLKSLILTFALLDQHISVEKAVELSRVELEYQTNIWGTVEYAHGLELLLTRSRVAAGFLFAYFNCEHSSKNMKKLYCKNESLFT